LIEAGRLSEANVMDLVKLRDALLMSSGASDALKNWENVSFTWALKDMQIVIKMADKAGLSLPIAGTIKELAKEGRRIKNSNPSDRTGPNRARLVRHPEAAAQRPSKMNGPDRRSSRLGFQPTTLE
jgi:3-hydroxyisobutyrate dehydrogenase/2-hydroxy-3-oxopropionate reductase